MNRKIAVTVLGLMALATFIGIAKAQIIASITVKDSGGNDISGGTVLINTIAYVYGHYEDLIGSVPASALMEVYYDDGTGWKHKATLFAGSVTDGGTIVKTYTMTELGTYEFRWTCVVTGTSSAGASEAGRSGVGTFCVQERAMARTKIQLVIPEPGTLAGLAMALAAFGFLAVKRMRVK